MVSGSSPGEENLTFLLCELLDANTTSLHALPYPLSQVQNDLSASDSGVTIDVEFQTHPHSKHVESRYSCADLGIVLEIAHPLRGYERRGFLIQAKRLFGVRKDREFGVYSGYDSFDRDQANFLKALQERFGAWNAVFYLWYNPSAVAFAAADSKIIRAYEAQGHNLMPYWGRIHPMIDELIDMGFPFALPAAGPGSAATDEEEINLRKWRLTQPALRISGLDVVLSASEHGPPRLKTLYDTVLERGRNVSFSPFAEFFLLALASSRYGSSDEAWVKLAEGQRIPMPPLKPATDKHTAFLEEFETPPTPRHTLKVTVRSTLPNVG
jgi:hypothetical protein